MHGVATILVVEDDANLRCVVAEQLQDLGYKPQQAENGATALALIEAGLQVDLVFTDIVMPGCMDGIDLAITVRSRWPGIPVLLTSGFIDPSRRESRELLTDVELLHKPYRLAELAGVLKRTLCPVVVSEAENLSARGR